MSSGFAGAPVSKTSCILISVGTALVMSNTSLLGYRVLWEGQEWWQLVTSLFSVESLGELFLCVHGFRVFRVLERHMGSAKFGSFLFLAMVLVKTTELALRLQNSSLRPLSGPHAILSALTTTYYGYIPSAAQYYFFTVGDFQVTEKTLTYGTAILLALSNRWSSTISTGCGVLMALVYWSRSSPLQRFRVPGQKVFALCGSFLMGDDMASRRMRVERVQQRGMRVGGGDGRQRLMDDMFNRMPGAPVGPTTATGLRRRLEAAPPSEEDITLLMGLGFDRETVIRVLRSSGNNTETAANLLLGH